MKAPATPEGRGTKLKQAQLPFARTPPALGSRPPPEPPAKRPRLDDEPSAPAPAPAPAPPSPPALVDEDSVEMITCEPIICDNEIRDNYPSSSPATEDEAKKSSDLPEESEEGRECDSTFDESLVVSDADDNLNESIANAEPSAGDPSSAEPTPSKVSKKQEWALKRAQREQERHQREMQRFSRKMEKMREQEEKEERKKQRELERKEKEEIRKKEQEERERERQLKQQIKEFKEIEMNRMKQHKLQEAENRNKKCEEEKLRKEQEKEKIENKKKKAAAAFKSFFVPKEKQSLNEFFGHQMTENIPNGHNFLSTFTIKAEMRLAPVVRHKINDVCKNALDEQLCSQSYEKNSLYLSNIKTNYSIKSSKKTWPIEDLKNELVIIEDDLPPIYETKDDNQIITKKKNHAFLRAKLFSFTENRRPPYWGTWQRKSKKINGKNPFAMDTALLDYDCDSDEEWEEEEPGESVESIAGSDDEEGDNEYDVDNEFMVPHGYLSDEEALGEDENALSPEALKAKLQYLEHEFEDEMKKPTKIKKPRLIGIIWQNSNGQKPETCPETIWNFLSSKSMITSESEIVIHSSNVNTESNIEDIEKSASKKNKKLPDEFIPDLIRLVHGNTNNRGFLVKEFQKYISSKNSSNPETQLTEDKTITLKEISNISIAKKIKELSTWMPCPDQGPMYTRMCWFSEKEVREKFNMGHLQLPNDWIYSLTPRNKSDSLKKEKANIENKDSPPKKENNFNITKFTKKLTKEERHKQFTSPVVTNATAEKTDEVSNTKEKQVPTVEKKRVTLKFLGPRDKTNTKTESKILPSMKLENASTENEQIKPPEVNRIDSKKRVPLLSSVPLAKDSPKPCRTNLLTQFIKTAKEKYGKSCDEMEVDDCIVLSD